MYPELAPSTFPNNHPSLLESLGSGITPTRIEIMAVYLTITDDPTTHINVHWHVSNKHHPVMEYRELGKEEWLSEEGVQKAFPMTKRKINHVKLSNLKPDTKYEFRFDILNKIHKFKTLPEKLDRKISFAIGGDMYHSHRDMDMINKRVAESDPDFIVVGGDWAYADGKPENYDRWIKLWDSWYKRMFRSDGSMIAVVPAIGNHEVQGHVNSSVEKSAFYFNMFLLPENKTYYNIPVGDYMNLLVLDTDHIYSIEHQTDFVEDRLNEYGHLPHVFPIYHVPAYPGGRAVDESIWRSTTIQREWVSLFEQHNVKLAFEHHDHLYKKTHPILNNEIDENGIVFLGDGCWGVGIRDVYDKDAWYLEDAKGSNHDSYNARHFRLITMENNKRTVEAINKYGEVFDSFEQNVEERMISYE